MRDTSVIRIVAVAGGLGTPSSSRRLVDRILTHVSHDCDAHGTVVDVTVIEVRELAVAIAERLTVGTENAELTRAVQAVRHADGLIAVTPVFNGSVAGLFKSFFDLFTPSDLSGVPIALGATGGSARHSMVIDFALRPLFAYLRALPMPTGVFAASADWLDPNGSHDEIEARAARTGRELLGAIRLARSGELPGRIDAATRVETRS